MKKLFFAAIGLVCLMASCSKDETETPAVNPNAGKEVQFTSSVGGATRTLYGEEYTNSIAVKWVTGDLISVYGVDCNVKQAEYKVTAAANSTTVDNMNYYYAESLDKTGAAGVQWGDDNTSDFFAVYPSTSNAFTVNADGSATVKTTVRPEQKVAFTFDETSNTWQGLHYNSSSSNPTMTDAVMYAYTKDAVATDAQGNTKAVDLKFNPFSTVLRFTFNGYQGYNTVTDGVYSEAYDSTISVTKIVLTAPNTYISGDFNLTIDNEGKASADNGTSQTIRIYPNYLPVKNGQKIQFDVFTIPQAHTLPIDEPWVVQLETSSGTFTYKLIPQKAGVETAVALSAAQLHKLTIPKLEFHKSGFEIPEDNWIKYIPRNVYVTELSYPGAWYYYHSDYQGDTSAQDLFDIGVRAFHIDCRLTIDNATQNVTADNEEGFYNAGNLQLSCAGTDAGGSNTIVFGVNGFSQGTKVADNIKALQSLLVKDESTGKFEEFIIVTLTIAEKPLTRTEYTLGTINPKYVLPAIQTAISNLITAGVPIYEGPITPNTTVNDVLGKIVVIVNENTTDATFSTYATPTALVSRGSMWWGVADYNFGSNLYQNSFNEMQTSKLYWKNAANTTDGDMTMYFHFAQRTSENAIGNDSDADSDYVHMAVLANRVSTVKAIATKAQEIYTTNTHNAWYQISTGGYIKNRIWNEGTEIFGTTVGAKWEEGDEPTVATRASLTKTLNDALLTIINQKLNSTENMIPSPVGIVLSNFSAYDTYSDNATDNATNSLSLNQAIFDMNTMFYLNRNQKAEEWPNGSPFPEVDTSTSGSGSGSSDGDMGDDQN